MSFSGKGRTWNQQDVIFFCKFAESLIITIRYFREEVECTLWFDTLKSQFSEVLIQNIAIFLIDADINACIQSFCDYLLEQGRSIYKSKDSGSNVECREDIGKIIHIVVYNDITDSFSRQGKRFTVRITDESIMEVVKNERNGDAVINDLTVRFVRNDIDAGGKLLFLFGSLCIR